MDILIALGRWVALSVVTYLVLGQTLFKKP